MQKGQASAETITVFSISLLIVLTFLVLGFNIMSDNARAQQGNDAFQAVRDLASASDDVYSQGEGAVKTVTIKLPVYTVFNANATYIGKPANLSGNSSIEARTIMINYSTGEISATAQEPVNGTFPSAYGTYKMRVVSKGNYVAIYPAVVDLSINSISASMAQNESRLFTVKFYRVSRETVNVTISSLWSTGDINVSISPTAFQPDESGTASTVRLSSLPTASGFYTSSFLVNATAYPSGTSEIILFPVSVEVQAG